MSSSPHLLRRAPGWARRCRRAVATALALAVLVGLAAGGALVGLTGTPAGAALPVEDYPAYDPQRTCSPSAKRGTVMLAEWLQRRYPGSGSSGISRDCAASGVSEHKEGRAFDWRLDARSERDRRYAADFVARVRQTDRAGNVAALGRRMGIMYLIWNDRIYSASRAYAPRPYLHAACRTVQDCSTTLRHRDHVHISLSWAGARARTSWYASRSQPAPTPAPTPSPSRPPAPSPAPAPAPPDRGTPALLDLSRTPQMVVAVRPGEARTTRYALRKGRRYRVTVHGVTRYGPAPGQVADAVCSWVPGRGWRPGVSPGTNARYGSLDLRVNGARLFGSRCVGGRHVYQRVIRPRRNRPLEIALDQPRGVAGRLVVAVTRPSDRYAARVPAAPARVPAPRGLAPEPAYAGGAVRTAGVVEGADAQGWTGQRLDAGVSYRLTVTGAMQVAPGVWTDGQCTSVAGVSGRWWPQASMDRYDPGADHGNIFFDGVPLAGSAPREDPDGCSSRYHATVITPTTSRRLQLQVWDPTPGAPDNAGSLAVLVDRLTPLAPAPPAASAKPNRSWRWYMREERLQVRGVDRSTHSLMRVRRGERVRLEVRGTVREGGGIAADAACVSTGDDAWSTSLGSPTGQDVMGLHVDGRSPRWYTPEGTAGCSPGHAYVATVTARHDGPLSLGFLDADHSDNSGAVSVTLTRR